MQIVVNKNGDDKEFSTLLLICNNCSFAESTFSEYLRVGTAFMSL